MAERAGAQRPPLAPEVKVGGDAVLYPPLMHPASLPMGELTDLLDAAFRQDHGEGTPGPSPATRAALADYLGCHQEARDTVWEMWQWRLARSTVADLGRAEYWLDAEVAEPCPL